MSATTEHADVVVLGAGIAGLTCARDLAASGAKVVVLEKSKGVGGRCATRRVDGQPVDHGVAFVHGSGGAFLKAVAEVDAELAPGWPAEIRGKGIAMQPETFKPGEQRVAYVDGVSRFPKHLARGLDVRLQTRVTGLEIVPGEARVTSENGLTISAPTVVLTTPPEQANVLWQRGEGATQEVQTAGHLVAQGTTFPCLTVMAGYARTQPPPDFCIMYPEDAVSLILKMLSVDSGKRKDPKAMVMVLQADIRFSRLHVDSPVEQWQALLLDEAARILGAWARTPLWAQSHAWRHARLDRGTELARPMLVEAAKNVRLGLAGEMFAPGGGLEAAWSSGRRLAARLLGKDA